MCHVYVYCVCHIDVCLLVPYVCMHTHQCDETQGNNSAQALSTKMVFFGCKKRDRQQKKKETKKRTDKELM